MAFPWIAVIFIVLQFLIFKYLKRRNEKEIVDCIPGPPALPIVGNLFDIAVRRENVMKGLMSRPGIYGPIYRTWMGSIPIVHVSKPEFVEVILNSSKHTRKGNFYRFLHPWLGSGLLTSSGKKWFDHRKLITPTFHFKILDNFLEVFSENSAILVEKLKRTSEDAEVVDVYPFVTLCALDIICETAMGIQIQAQNGRSPTYVESLYKISELTTARSNKLWQHPDFIFYNLSCGREYKKHLRNLHNFTEKVIKDRKLLREKEKKTRLSKEETENDIGTKKRQAFLDLLLDAAENDGGSCLSDTDIREEVDTFMFEGHDTTTAGICWTLHCLGLNPNIQNDVAEEQKSIFAGDKLKPPSMRHLGEMKILERVIKETLRLYPSVSFISRKLDEEVTLGKYTLPPETTVAIDIINIHRNPEVFPSPEIFDPNRWLPENLINRHPYSYIPFSAGPRNCIGQKFALLEEKTVLSFILRNYEVETVQKPEELTLTNELILRPLQGIKLKIKKRK
ncbi:UNVERIFIED_CONTAM: hypothetical protein PYX00_000242 [Menopon gallinae]|uniref:Cytochrome P450 n=1 Tax=Menopon gallinae TaxID=328185 RepID=A0AAW2I9A0_9NEOP